MNQKNYDLFVTHAWRYHQDWTAFCTLLDNTPGLIWRNFSLPWHDPAMSPNSTVGSMFIRDVLKSQIVPVHGVIFLAGVYGIKSAQAWLDLEIEVARDHNKPVIAIPPMGEITVPHDMPSFCDASAGWCGEEVIAALDHARALRGYAVSLMKTICP